MDKPSEREAPLGIMGPNLGPPETPRTSRTIVLRDLRWPLNLGPQSPFLIVVYSCMSVCNVPKLYISKSVNLIWHKHHHTDAYVL